MNMDGCCFQDRSIWGALGLQVSMAQKILQENDPKKTKKDRKKDKKKKKKSSSSSDDSTGSESVNFLDDLQLQCCLKPKHMNLKDLVRLDDLKPVA